MKDDAAAAYRNGLRDGYVCGLVAAATYITQSMADGDAADELAWRLLGIAGAETLEDVKALRNKPAPEHDIDYLVCHLGRSLAR